MPSFVNPKGQGDTSGQMPKTPRPLAQKPANITGKKLQPTKRQISVILAPNPPAQGGRKQAQVMEKKAGPTQVAATGPKKKGP